MSTILDALKKAKDTPPPKESVDAQREILSAKSHDYLATASTSPDDSLRTMRLLVIGLAVIVFLLLLTVILLAVNMGKSPEPQQPATIAQTTATPTPNPTPVPTPQPTPQPTAAATAATPAAQPPAVVHVHFPSPTPSSAPKATPEPTPVPTATPTPVPSANQSEELQKDFRALKLQGIFWVADDPSAIINGKDVSTGDIIGDQFKVTKIDPESVTLEAQGKEFILR
jgi:cytoskeletal protein RodZ